MKIAFDLDETLFPFVDPFLDWFNTKYDTIHQFKDCTDYRMWKILNITEQDYFKELVIFTQTDYYKHIKPYPGAIELVESMSNIAPTTLISARGTSIEEQTRDLIEIHFNGHFNNGNMTLTYNYKTGIEQCKAELCLKKDVCIMFEDRAKNVNSLSDNNITSFLITKPWNASRPIHDNVIRYNSLKYAGYHAQSLYKELKFNNSITL